MDIAVIGAAGDVGRAIATRILAAGLLERHERLQLVERPGGPSERILEGLTVDLMDAFAEQAPLIDVALDPNEVTADIVIMVAGGTVPTKPDPDFRRDRLARQNAEIFRAYARSLAANGSGHELVVVVSNPVELAVAIFARELGRERVFGMAAYLDSLRFRKEIARELRVSRRGVHGFMAGEHGDNLVPLWSTVHIFGLDAAERERVLARIRRGSRTAEFVAKLAEVKRRVSEWMTRGEVRAALRYLDGLAPDVRVAAKPFVSHFAGAKTIAATAEAAIEFVSTIHNGHDILVSGQIVLAGEYGIRGPIGVPFVLSSRGVEEVVELPLEEEEGAALAAAAAAIGKVIDGVSDAG
ncbi:MAG: lactate dehydrogenase [Planctomycetes bacterium]|nr:lactate dehydrogenase [Planctomycetota bacterium]